jgi:transposase
MPSAATILPDPACLQLLRLTADANTITATVLTTAPSARCPLCGEHAVRVHSRYTRRLADLPWHGIALRLVLHVRKFFCDHAACARCVFTERLPQVVAPYARRTLRLAHWFMAVGFAAGGAAGARLLRELGVGATAAMVLARVRAAHCVQSATPRVLGVDDFAFRRRRRYGTILVDLERRRPVDLLPDRSAATLARWLKVHPGVEIISRDRGGDYAVGAREGAPNALQIADRFHLVKNLGELLERVVRRHAAIVERLTVTTTLAHSVATAPPRAEREETRHQAQDRIRRRYEAIHALAAQGLSGLAIARTLGIHRHTVERNLRLPTCPERARHPRKPNSLDPFEPYLRERWAQGYHNALGLWREIQGRGFTGTSRTVSRFVTYLRQQEREQERRQEHGPEEEGQADRDRRGLSVREAVGLLLRHHDDLTVEQQVTRTRVCQAHPEISQTEAVLSRFRQVLHDHDPHALAPWLEAAEQSGVQEIRAFVTKLRQDLPAVQAAVTFSWSQGQVEGQVNRVKLLKRSMYGRAKFDLLKQRVLYRSASA